MAGWAAVYAMPDGFVSSARVRADADAVLGLPPREATTAAAETSPAERVEILRRTLLSRPNLERVVAHAGLKPGTDGPASRERLLDEFAGRVRVVSQEQDLFRIEYADQSPELARAVVQAVLAVFEAAATASDRQRVLDARESVAQQLAANEAQLREAERRRAEFQARFADLLPSDAPGGASRLEAGRARLVALRGELQDMRAWRDLARQHLGSVPAFVATAGPGGLAVNPFHERLRLRLVDAEASVASLERETRDREAEVERLDAVARSVPDVHAQFAALDRDHAAVQRRHEELLERRDAVQAADAARRGADRGRLEVVDPPTLPAAPSGPGRPLLFSAVLAAGLGAGAALALLLSRFDGGFYTAHDLRRLGVPVLGAISAPPQPGRFGSAAAFTAGLALLFAAFAAVLMDAPRMVPGMLA